MIPLHRTGRLWLAVLAQAMALVILFPGPARAQSTLFKVTDQIYMATGSGNISSNTYMVLTSAGVVIIDTSNPTDAPTHYQLLRTVTTAPVRYVIITHGHGDHTGGINLWKQAGTKVIAQSNIVELLNYQTRLTGFFAPRNAAQAGKPPPVVTDPYPGNYAAVIPADTLFEKTYQFVLGGYTFNLSSAPGETPDMLNVWIPELSAMFVGDNYYKSFPNIHTLRGTKPRWALDYITSLNTVIGVNPYLLLPSHGYPINGKPAVQAALKQYRDAIQYVHDAVVSGMDTGVDQFALMKSVKLPPNLDIGESYGRVSWSVRGIYEGYAGWFDADAGHMYATQPKDALATLVGMTTGGAEGVALQARSTLSGGGDPVIAIHLADAAIAADPVNVTAWTVRRDALQSLRDRSDNGIERNWLQDGINKANAKINGTP